VEEAGRKGERGQQSGAIALICITNCQIPASVSTNQGLENDELLLF
jgi:hypothetical protein